MSKAAQELPTAQELAKRILMECVEAGSKVNIIRAVEILAPLYTRTPEVLPEGWKQEGRDYDAYAEPHERYREWIFGPPGQVESGCGRTPAEALANAIAKIPSRAAQRRGRGMKMSRSWAMASANTFTIEPIRQLISGYMEPDLMTQNKGRWIDPFARNSIFKKDCIYTNDVNPAIKCTHNLDALDFCKLFPDGEFDGVLFDPPFSPRQAKEEYQGFGSECPDTSRAFWSDRKNECARVLKKGGIAICCGWNSGGLGKKNGMEMIEVLLVNHGQQNDTIVTVERKSP